MSAVTLSPSLSHLRRAHFKPSALFTRAEMSRWVAATERGGSAGSRSCAQEVEASLCNLLSLPSACSCFLLNIHAPPCSLLPKTHDIKCCLTTISGERRTINGAHFMGFTHGIPLTWNSFIISLDKEGTAFNPSCCFVSFKYVCPDAREQRIECSSLLEQFRNLMHNVQQNRRLQICPLASVGTLCFFTLARGFLYSPSRKATFI